jgi:enoyl-CoA hydratase/carnithine racemase
MIVKEQDGLVRVLRLANPPANMLSLGLLEALRREIAHAASDSGVRCLVLASSYPRYFSAGLDLEELMTLPPDKQSSHFEAILGAFRDLRALGKPTLAAMSGTAVLGGWILAMACDWRIMADAPGKVSLAEIRIGLSPSAMLIGRLQQIAKDPVAVKEMVLKGKSLRVPEAYAAGLLDRVVSSEHLQEEVMSEARSLTKIAPAAYAAAKKALWRRPVGDEEAIWRESIAEFQTLFAGPEAQEGVAAFREKRKPRWEK